MKRPLLRAAILERSRAGVELGAPVRPASLWRALLDGRCKIIDCFEEDRRCYLVAQRNPKRDARALALRHAQRRALTLLVRGHSLTEVADTLGLSRSGLSELVSGALSKMGVGSRAELIRIAMACGA